MRAMDLNIKAILVLWAEEVTVSIFEGRAPAPILILRCGKNELSMFLIVQVQFINWAEIDFSI